MKPFGQSDNAWRGEVLKALQFAHVAKTEVWRTSQGFNTACGGGPPPKRRHLAMLLQ